MKEMFAVLSDDIIGESRSHGNPVPLADQMVNGWQMRALIGDFLHHLGEALRSGRINRFEFCARALADEDRFAGLALGCLSDLCFNMEYVRRITDHKWSYCSAGARPRVFYPYLGVCPYCITRVDKPRGASLGVRAGAGAVNGEVTRRYFGNKIQSHHVGRIGERAITFILDFVSKAYDRNAETRTVTDDQHDIDSIFSVGGIAVLTQIKSSPLFLMPVVATLERPLLAGQRADTGLPEQRRSHTFLDFETAERSLGLYLPLLDEVVDLGPRGGVNWPYDGLRSVLDENTVLRFLDQWLAVFLSFEIPKKQRRRADVKRAWLSSGWGAPIDDNKTKPGLARSDNMMKGTYACVKYGAYYAQMCKRKTLRAALVANIDPAHQYADYLQKLEDIRWGHNPDFTGEDLDIEGSAQRFSIAKDDLQFLFDGLFTFNRRILNDPVLSKAWNLKTFLSALRGGQLDDLLQDWRAIPVGATDG